MQFSIPCGHPDRRIETPLKTLSAHRLRNCHELVKYLHIWFTKVHYGHCRTSTSRRLNIVKSGIGGKAEGLGLEQLQFLLEWREGLVHANPQWECKTWRRSKNPAPVAKPATRASGLRHIVNWAMGARRGRLQR